MDGLFRQETVTHPKSPPPQSHWSIDTEESFVINLGFSETNKTFVGNEWCLEIFCIINHLHQLIQLSNAAGKDVFSEGTTYKGCKYHISTWVMYKSLHAWHLSHNYLFTTLCREPWKKKSLNYTPPPPTTRGSFHSAQAKITLQASACLCNASLSHTHTV